MRKFWGAEVRGQAERRGDSLPPTRLTQVLFPWGDGGRTPPWLHCSRIRPCPWVFLPYGKQLLNEAQAQDAGAATDSAAPTPGFPTSARAASPLLGVPLFKATLLC